MAKESAAKKEPPRSLAVAAKGIHTSSNFAQLMSALMSDLIEGRVAPNVGNATCNAGGKLLKVVELEQKYGTQGDGQTKTLRLADPMPTPEDAAREVRRAIKDRPVKAVK